MQGILKKASIAIIVFFILFVIHHYIQRIEIKEEKVYMGEKKKFAHDNPDHPWHWTREKGPCPELSKKKDCKGMLYIDLYNKFQEEGWVVFDSCSLKRNEASIIDRVANFTKGIDGGRVMNAEMLEVRQIAVDPDSLQFLEFIHGGRRIFPFQTLNFQKGTQQPIHSDIIHFDTQPRTLMTAAWVALEDMNKDNGPLRFYPKSHQWGTWDYAEMGMHQKYDIASDKSDGKQDTQVKYGYELEKAMKQLGLRETVASELKKGQTFIWAAGLVHGGSIQNNMELTRLSQVSHYYFEGSNYWWVPRLSDLAEGKIHYRNGEVQSCKPQFVPIGGAKEFHSCADGVIETFIQKYQPSAPLTSEP